MTYLEFLRTERWKHFRDEMWDRDKGTCRICGAPGRDVHHWTYSYGLLNPDTVYVVCRPCHEIWQGKEPDHLPDDHWFRPQLMRIAEIVRHLPKDRSWLWRGWSE
ncbi:MAG: hypothetical protein IH899_18850 [Planctomycetes bacterium]|nr:hypothetical protein [Planctomycetota bacterium]